MSEWRMRGLLGGLLVLVGAVVCTAQLPIWGKCPNVEVQPNFELNRYLGKWFEYERFFAIFEFGSVCAQANYSLKADGHVKVFNQGYRPRRGKFDQIEGDAISNAMEPAKLGVKFVKFQPRAPYWVLATDYDTFSLVWSCTDLLVAHIEIAWILTRERGVLDAGLEQDLFNLLRDYGINPNKFTVTNQTNCPI